MTAAPPKGIHPSTMDETARRLVAEVSESVSRELHGPRLTQPLLNELYLRVRERLLELGALGVAREEVVENLALTIYLAWLAEGGDLPGPRALVVLKTSVARALEGPARGRSTGMASGPGPTQKAGRRR